MKKDCKNSKISLIAGLGNPGLEHEFSYHNTGKNFVSWLIHKAGGSPQIQKEFEYCRWKNVFLVIPRVFMNDSGKAVKAAVKFLKVKPELVLLTHDDTDIELGKYKIQFQRGAAGHKGVESVIKHLSTNSFWRLRFGIRVNNKKSGPRMKAEKLVLKKIDSKNQKIIQKVFEKAASEILPFL